MLYKKLSFVSFQNGNKVKKFSLDISIVDRHLSSGLRNLLFLYQTFSVYTRPVWSPLKIKLFSPKNVYCVTFPFIYLRLLKIGLACWETQINVCTKYTNTCIDRITPLQHTQTHVWMDSDALLANKSRLLFRTRFQAFTWPHKTDHILDPTLLVH
jgi:hypothetical protein